MLTHVIEARFLWTLALLSPQHNSNNLNAVDFALDVMQFKGDPHMLFSLLLVPGLVLFFLVGGPGATKLTVVQYLNFPTILALLLGLLEFGVILNMEVFGGMPVSAFYPGNFLDDTSTRALFSATILFLGLLRVSWAVGGRTVGSWACIVSTHACEAALFWSLAMCPHFISNGIHGPLEAAFVLKNALGGKFTAEPTIILLGVPLLTLFFLFNGPDLEPAPLVKVNPTKAKKQ